MHIGTHVTVRHPFRTEKKNDNNFWTGVITNHYEDKPDFYVDFGGGEGGWYTPNVRCLIEVEIQETVE